MFRENHRIQFHHSTHSSSVHKGAIGKVVFDSKAERFAVACTFIIFQIFEKRRRDRRFSFFDFEFSLISIFHHIMK